MTRRGLRLQWRIMVRLLPMLALVFVGVWHWLGGSLEEALYAATLEIAGRSNAVAVSAIRSAMAASKGAHPEWGRVVETIAGDDGTEIQLINVRGEVLLSSAPNRRGTAYRLADVLCSVCHGDSSGQASTQTALIRDHRDESYQVFTAALDNSEDCRTCHSGDGPKLGMVFVRQSLEPVRAQVRAMRTGVAVAGAVAMILTVLTIRVLLARYLGRPLKRVVAGARAIGAGHLEHTVELAGRTELSELADTLNASTARLAGLQQELVEKERLAATGETVAGLAHCLKNTLNGLRAGQYVIDRGLEKNDIEKLQTGWRVMKQAVSQVESLASDMLYCVKERIPEREPTDPNEVLGEVVELLGEMAIERGVELRAALDERIGVAALDRTMIYRAIVNLVTNAIEACSELDSGGSVVVRSRGAPDEVVLTVADNGVGMSDDTQSRAFTRFFSTKPASGTGLGLLVVKTVAGGHGGALRVESELGKGSEFHLHLPRTPASQTCGRSEPHTVVPAT